MMKYNVITTIVVIVSFLLGGVVSVHAQGVYNNNYDKVDKKTDDSGSGGGGLYRAWGDGEDGGTTDDGGNERPGEPGGPGTRQPIGEGILILSFLSCGYALIKRNVRRKHEE